LNIKLCDLVVVVVVVVAFYPLFSPNPLSTRKLKADEEQAVSQIICGCWVVLLNFAPCRPLPRPRRPTHKRVIEI
jgi:hypothetical protein